MANNNGKYYLICNYDHYNTLAHYKIDQITNIKILPRTNIKPLEMLDDYEPNFDITKYINEKIYMFSGSSVDATLKVSNKVINDVLVNHPFITKIMDHIIVGFILWWQHKRLCCFWPFMCNDWYADLHRIYDGFTGIHEGISFNGYQIINSRSSAFSF